MSIRVHWAQNYFFMAKSQFYNKGNLSIKFRIYFESLFNKKNLFFGRTKLFVPK